MTYPGGKNGMGVYQRIINLMPPHKTYVEGFCGSGAVIRKKRLAEVNIAIDLSEDALDLTASMAGNRSAIQFVKGDCMHFLESTAFRERANDALVYLDPPYLMETRKGGALYDHEMTNDDHHRLMRIVQIISGLGAKVMISGYRSGLYDDALRRWTRIAYQAQTRRGRVEECLWMNFPTPTELHDYSHLGDTYRQRENIKRKKVRWAKKLASMNRLERLAVMDAIQSLGADPPPGG